jgi:thiol-disulfide isomerase/thioredoxin
MDRLSALIRVALVAVATAGLPAACSRGADDAGPARTDKVIASVRAPEVKDWCDAYYGKADAPRLALPKVVAARPGEQLPTIAPDRWVWLNLWATWCEPCRREMPLLVEWHSRLVKEGVPLDLLFVSVDEREQELVEFLKANPTMAPGESVRLTTFSELNPWLASFKGAPTGTIPLQIIAGPQLKVRCIRAGSLREGDFPVVKQFFQR